MSGQIERLLNANSVMCVVRKLKIPLDYAVKVWVFSCFDHTFPVHLFYQLYMQETGNMNITSLVQ